MTPTWYSKDIPPGMPNSPSQWILGVLRGVLLVCFIFLGLLFLLALRLIEGPLFGVHRPVTPKITQFVCRNSLRILGIPYQITGNPISGSGAIVANHSSWLDIFSLNAATPLYFVSKEEVAGWAGIGWLAKATGTVFIRRDRKEAVSQIKVFRDRLAAGHKLLFFPEGTSTDGLQVLPFKPTLFAAFFADDLKETVSVQAVTVVYQAPSGEDARFYGWWGDMALAPHLWSTLAARKHGKIEVIYHEPIALKDAANRKALASELESRVRSGLPVRT